MRRYLSRICATAVMASVVAFAANPSSAATTLRQKWEAGQKLAYTTNIDGTMSMQLPASTPIMIAGMPLEINVRAAGKTILDTVKVSDFGDGTVQVKVDPLNIEAESFGYKALIKTNNGKVTTSLNGSPQKFPIPGLEMLASPPATLTFSPQMKAVDFSLKAPTAGSTDNAASPAGMVAVIQNLILQSLPAMLPNKSVNPGDEWSADVQIKTSPAPDAATFKLGSFNFQLKDAEKSGDKTLQHITVQGALSLPTDQSRALMDAMKDSGATEQANQSKQFGEMAKMFANRVFNFTQSVDGDLYFDADAGHFSRANLNIRAGSESQASDGKGGVDGFMDFDGTLQLRLDP